MLSMPSTVQAGVPFTVCVRAVAAPETAFRPNGRALLQARLGPVPEECEADLRPASAARTSIGGCRLVTTAPPGNLGIRASYNAALAAFALPDGRHPASILQVVTATAGVTALALIDGNGQSATLGSPFALPLRVRATNAQGAPVAGVAVNFSAPNSGARAVLNRNTALTDATGIASVLATAAGVTGVYTVNARINEFSQSFTLTNLEGPSLFVNGFEGPQEEAIVCPDA
jgi:hypothetical protein